jgi:hypothetical protein
MEKDNLADLFVDERISFKSLINKLCVGMCRMDRAGSGAVVKNVWNIDSLKCAYILNR